MLSIIDYYDRSDVKATALREAFMNTTKYFVEEK